MAGASKLERSRLFATVTPILHPIAQRTHCAWLALQVLEETGLDITGLLQEQDYIDAQLGDQDTRLFIVEVSMLYCYAICVFVV